MGIGIYLAFKNNKMKILKSGLTLLTFVIMLTGCGSNGSSNGSDYIEERPLTEAELKAQLHDKECSSPSEYLDGTLSYKPKFKNALSLKVKALKLECNISSSATLATFKDVNFHVVFKSKTGTVILEKDFTIYEFYAPGKTVVYKTEMDIENQDFDDIADIEWTIESATCN